MSFRKYGGTQFASSHNIVKSNVNTTGNFYVTQNIGQPNTYIDFLSDISGNMNIYGNLDVSGNVGVSADVDISGNLRVQQNIDCSGNLRVQQDIDCSGNVDIDGKLHVQQDIDCSGNVTAEYMFLSSGTSYTTASNGVVPKSYIDSVANGLTPLPPCILCSDAGPINLFNYGQSIDGFTITPVYDGSAVLINAQGGYNVANINNGVYIVSSGTWQRASYLDTGDTATSTATLILQGITLSNYRFVCTSGSNTSPAFVGVSPLLWTPFEVPFSLGQGLSKYNNGGNTVVQVDSSLNFINYLDNTAGPNPGTINIGTYTSTTNISNSSSTCNINAANTYITGNTVTNSIQSLDPSANINIGTTLTYGDIFLGGSPATNVALNWGGYSNSGQLTFRGGNFNLESTGNYDQQSGAIYSTNISTSQTSGIMNIGTSATRSGAININTGATATAPVNISSATSANAPITIGSTGSSSQVVNINGANISIGSNNTSTFTLNPGATGAFSLGTNMTGGSITIGNNSATTSTTVTNIANGAGQQGALNIGSISGNGRAINIGNLSTGGVTTIQGATLTLNPATTGFLNLGTGMTGGSITIGATGASSTTIDIGNSPSQSGAINIGAGASNKNITIGNTTGGNINITGANALLRPSSSVGIGDNMTGGTITIGRGDSSSSGTTINIGNASGYTGPINIGAGASSKNITIGNTTGGVTTIQGATLTLNPQATGFLNLGAGMTGGSITLGATGASSTIINIGNADGQTGTINIGTGTSAAKTINIGSINSGTTTTNIGGSGVYIGGNNTTTLQANPIAASGFLNLGTNMTGGTITIGNNSSTAAAAATIINIGNAAGQTGGINIGTGTSSKTITIGGSAIGSTSIQGLNVVCSGTNASLRGTNITQMGDTMTSGSIYIGRSDATVTTATINIGAGAGNTGAITINRNGGGNTNINGWTILGSNNILNASGDIQIDTTGAAAGRGMFLGGSISSGPVQIAAGNNQTGAISIGTGTSSKNITIGNTTGGVTTIQGATLTLNPAGSGSLNLGTGMTGGGITIGATGASSTTIAIGNGSGQTGAISIGTGSSAKTITIGSSASTVAINGTTTINGTTNFTGGIATTTLSASGLITASGGLTLTGATNINTDVSNSTNIGNTGGTTTVTGTTNINTSGSSSTTIGNGSSSTTVTGATNINTSGSSSTTIGNGSSSTIINSKVGIGKTPTSTLDVSGNVTVTNGLITANAGLTVTGTTTVTGSLITSMDASINTLTVGKGGSNISTNTAFGFQTLKSNTTGQYNTAIGYTSLTSNIDGSYNVAVGYGSLFSNTNGFNNTALGYNSLTGNTGGYNNTAVGTRALATNTTGFRNTSIGCVSLEKNTTGQYNAAIGNGSLRTNTTGSNNIAIGDSSLEYNITGSYNTAIGDNSLIANTSGGNNTAIGASSLAANTIGQYNTAIGRFSGDDLSGNSNYNTFLGYNATVSSSTSIYNNSTAVGYNAMIDASNQMVLGGVLSGLYPGIKIPGSYVGINGVYNPTSGNVLDVSGNTKVSGTLVVNNINTDASANDLNLGQNLTTGNINIGANLTTGDINLGGSPDTQVDLNWGGSSNSGNLSFRGGTFGLNATGEYNQQSGAIYSTNISTNQTTGIMNIGTSATRSGAININTGATASAPLNISSLTTVNAPITIGSTASSTQTCAMNAITTFSKIPSCAVVPAGVNDLCNKYYVDTAIGNTSILGTPNTWTGTNAFNNTAVGSLTSAATQPGTTDNSTKVPTTAWVQNVIATVGSSQWTTSGSNIYYNSTGNVGIGTIPSSTLDVSGNARIRGRTYFGIDNPGGGLSDTAYMEYVAISGEQTTLRINVQNDTNDNINLNPTGNVGINTDTPAYKLDVTGTLRTTGSLITTMDASINTLTVGKGGGNVSNNTAFGFQTLKSNTTGQYNTAIGYTSLTSNIDGSYNVAVGYGSLATNTTGNYNIAIGYRTLETNTTGASNTAIGSISLQKNTTGYENTAIGIYSLATNINGVANTAIGESSLIVNTTGNNNTAIGANSLAANTIGQYNTAIGRFSGNDLSGNSNYNTFLGYNADVSSNTLIYNNSTAVGYNAIIDASNQMVLGGLGPTISYPGIKIPGSYVGIGGVYNPASGNKLDVNGNVNISNGGLTSSGLITATGGIYTNTITAPGGLTVSGLITASNGLTATDLITANAGLTVTGGATAVTGATNINTSGSSLTTIGNGSSTTIINSKVGIGKTPSSTLDVSGNVTVTNGLITANNGLTVTAGTTAVTGATNINTSGSSLTTIGNGSSSTTVTGATNINTSGSSLTTIGNDSSTTIINSKVGIGTTNPQYLLDVSGNGRFNNSIYLYDGANNSIINKSGSNLSLINNNAGGNIVISNSNYLTNNFTFNFDSSGNKLIFNDNSSDTGFIRWYSPNDSNSYLQIGTTDNAQSGPSEKIYFTQYEYSNTTTYVRMRIDGTGVWINPSGDTYFTAASTYSLNVNGTVNATSFNTTSDYRIKNDVTPLDEKFTVDKLRPVNYNNTESGKQDVGLIAHELQEVYPFLVNGEKDGENLQSVNYTGLIAILIKEIQELKERVKKLEGK